MGWIWKSIGTVIGTLVGGPVGAPIGAGVGHLIDKAVEPPTEFHITMLGPRGVGKTSLLSGMYDQIERVTQGTNLYLAADKESSIRLGDRLAKLKRVPNAIQSSPLRGDAEVSEFRFSMGLDKDKPRFDLVFRDFPGGYLTDPLHGDDVEEFVKKSQVILIAVDAPALMELDGVWHEEINRPSRIKDFFKKVLPNIPDAYKNKLIIFCPLKCEVYYPHKIQSLVEDINEGYSDFLSILSQGAYSKNLAVTITPVHTLGKVIFDRAEEISDNEIQFFFRKVDPDGKGYAPRYVEQPLCYLLPFVVWRYFEQRNLERKFYDRFHKRDDKFHEAITRIESRRSGEAEGFYVIQGQHLLTREG